MKEFIGNFSRFVPALIYDGEYMLMLTSQMRISVRRIYKINYPDDGGASGSLYLFRAAYF